MTTSVIPEQIEHFNGFASKWWDYDGPLKGLHSMNPTRITFINGVTGGVHGLTVLDVGCGGGIACEPLARLGATVTGIDAAPDSIAAAIAHAADQGLSITYAHETVENHHGVYDLVTALDIIEHVDDPKTFIAALATKLKPGGKLVLSTLNRTWKSYAFGIVAAENILHLAPKGSHDWQKFITPAELSAHCRAAGLTLTKINGLYMNPLTQAFTLSDKHLGINYMLAATLT